MYIYIYSDRDASNWISSYSPSRLQIAWVLRFSSALRSKISKARLGRDGRMFHWRCQAAKLRREKLGIWDSHSGQNFWGMRHDILDTVLDTRADVSGKSPIAVDFTDIRLFLAGIIVYELELGAWPEMVLEHVGTNQIISGGVMNIVGTTTRNLRFGMFLVAFFVYSCVHESLNGMYFFAK